MTSRERNLTEALAAIQPGYCKAHCTDTHTAECAYARLQLGLVESQP